MRQETELRAYQQRLATHLYEHTEAIAVVRMGGGKTASTLTAINDLLKDGEISHALIVAPKRVAEKTWPDEIREWEHTGHLRFTVMNGDPRRRAADLAQRGNRDITIIGIENVPWLVDIIAELPDDDPIFDCLVLDEISRFRNPKSKGAKALMTIINRFRNRWGMTGTPRPNGYEDLFMPARLVTCNKLWGRSYYAWRQANFYPTDYMGYRWRVLPNKEQGLIDDFRTISVALDDGDMPELPEIQTLLTTLPLPREIAAEYHEMERKLFTEIRGKEVTAKSMGVAVGKLSQMLAGFVYVGEGSTRTVERLHTVKLGWLVDLVEALAGQPLLIAYEFQAELDRLRDAFGEDLPYLGQGVSGRDANIAIDRWNKGELPVMALHPASGGHGLNLQHGGSNIAWPSLTWSAEFYEQTIARIHRPGQPGKVTVHVCEMAPSVDELKRWRVIDKIDDQDAFARFLDRL